MFTFQGMSSYNGHEVDHKIPNLSSNFNFLQRLTNLCRLHWSVTYSILIVTLVLWRLHQHPGINSRRFQFIHLFCSVTRPRAVSKSSIFRASVCADQFLALSLSRNVTPRDRTGRKEPLSSLTKIIPLSG